MAKKKPGRKPDPTSKRSQGLNRHRKPRVSFHLDQELLDSLHRYINAQRAKPDISEVMRISLEAFLEEEGYWPTLAQGGAQPKAAEQP